MLSWKEHSFGIRGGRYSRVFQDHPRRKIANTSIFTCSLCFPLFLWIGFTMIFIQVVLDNKQQPSQTITFIKVNSIETFRQWLFPEFGPASLAMSAFDEVHEYLQHPRSCP
eukprot:m.219112 g.219112  ORF g.219112 m.219112 type:complete len:111 (-) comp13821_c0_seq16:2386-2718(-)